MKKRSSRPPNEFFKDTNKFDKTCEKTALYACAFIKKVDDLFSKVDGDKCMNVEDLKWNIQFTLAYSIALDLMHDPKTITPLLQSDIKRAIEGYAMKDEILQKYSTKQKSDAFFTQAMLPDTEKKFYQNCPVKK
ncbi:hypothetical protein DMB92_01630 [Campylobacter sp. MIT 99-7217]|uniref:hypothetical protein n=1 Tax=Campylobacter sp. MIT 99-7217 TaxID=535091 RepID=UPI00115B3979|nr:hypothetical protein [Campylobacter sp. MIT 99-7217]TQR34686.1 hypothetical protein DMB92_01630 [Campylobacter sp. MIT 99-7217]